MVSNVTVNRVQDNGSGKTVDKGNVFLFVPGKTADIYQYDESHGTNPDVNCQKDRITVSESTTCTIAFTAPGSEIRNSYWEIDAQAIGTWPGQIVP